VSVKEGSEEANHYNNSKEYQTYADAFVAIDEIK
jgi:hypothetical protein